MGGVGKTAKPPMRARACPRARAYADADVRAPAWIYLIPLTTHTTLTRENKINGLEWCGRGAGGEGAKNSTRG